MQQLQILYIHFDIYSTMQNINLLFYELLCLRILNNSGLNFFFLPNGLTVHYFIEIASTMNE